MRHALIVFALALGLLPGAPRAAAQSAGWTDLGFALAGTLGEPVLKAEGPLAGGSVLQLDLTRVLPHHHAYLVAGFGVVYAPYKLGILVPKPDVLVEFSTGEFGSVTVLVHWPHGIPAGVPFAAQFWINDEGAPAGRAGSNAVGKFTP